MLDLTNASKSKKVRLDHLLTERSLAESGAQAQRLVMAGLVYVNGQKAAKAGSQVRPDVEIEVRETLRYVSRGGLKLNAALDHFDFGVDGLVCLDVGASTGGFTDCLLQRGAEKVYAVDVGRGQLHYRLQKDARIVSLERTHIRDLTREQVPENIDALVIDTSFISLVTVLPLAWKFLAPGGWCVALIKPQFEVGPKLLSKGVVRDEAARVDSVEKVKQAALMLEGASVKGIIESPIHGPKGNVEFLIALGKG
ncbi:MAG: TlyA family rRNA (cytidine-2'-O)-methyltransferase [Zetaproteobacteria bacterium]|nr:MAG: TlyA family rRNA (cytidine-2'-O)-methyltransferase [Zetaproteobacteria bacterium]